MNYRYRHTHARGLPTRAVRHYPFTPEQARHVGLMRAIAQELTSRTGDAFVLKGVTAILLPNILSVSPTDAL